MFFNPGVALFSNGPDGCGCCVENIDLMFFNNSPEPSEIRIVGNAFKHDRGGTVTKRSVNNVGVTGYPADISRAPEHITIMVIKNHLVGIGGIDQITACGVHNTFGSTG